jgi:DNA-binding XRE family transcriptional regulator
MGIIFDRPRQSLADFGLSAARRFDQSGSPAPGDYTGLLQAASGPARFAPACQIVITDQVIESTETDSPWIGQFMLAQDVRPLDPNQIDHVILYHSWVVMCLGNSAATALAAPEIASPHEQLAEVAETFSLNATQLARVFGVSRQTIYNWRKGEAIDTAHRPRLGSLHDLARRYRRHDPKPIGPALTWPDTTSGASLLDLLSARPHDHATIRRHLEALPSRIAVHFGEANAAIECNKDDGFAPIPDAWRRETLRSLGAQNAQDAILPPDDATS